MFIKPCGPSHENLSVLSEEQMSFFLIFHHLFSKWCPDSFLGVYVCGNSTGTKTFAGLQKPWPWTFHGPGQGTEARMLTLYTQQHYWLNLVSEMWCAFMVPVPLTTEKASGKGRWLFVRGRNSYFYGIFLLRNLRSRINSTILLLSWILPLNNYKYFGFLSLFSPLFKNSKDFSM